MQEEQKPRKEVAPSQRYKVNLALSNRTKHLIIYANHNSAGNFKHQVAYNGIRRDYIMRIKHMKRL